MLELVLDKRLWILSKGRSTKELYGKFSSDDLNKLTNKLTLLNKREKGLKFSCKEVFARDRSPHIFLSYEKDSWEAFKMRRAAYVTLLNSLDLFVYFDIY